MPREATRGFATGGKPHGLPADSGMPWRDDDSGKGCAAGRCPPRSNQMRAAGDVPLDPAAHPQAVPVGGRERK